MGKGHSHHDHQAPGDQLSEGFELGVRITWLGIWVGVGLTVAELLAGYYGLSQALLADGVHSAEDTLATVVVLITLKVAQKPADAGHPYGHGRVESLTAVGLGLVLGTAGLAIIWSVATSLAEGVQETPTFLALGIAFASIGVREGLYQITYRAGKQSESPALIANAWHHRTDALSSIGALVGIGGAQLGLRFLDPIAGGLIAIFIIKVAIEIVYDALGQLMDRAPEPGVMEKIKLIAEEADGVEHVHEVKARYAGRSVLVDLKVDIDAALTVAQGHDIAGDVKHRIIAGVRNVVDVMVHVNPHSHPHDHSH